MNHIFSAGFSLILTVTVMGSLMFGNALHSTIPHSHGYAETGHEHKHEQNEESASWASLHSALRHEGKKLLLLAAIISLTGIVAVISIALRSELTALALANTRIYDPLLGEYLRRGIAPYRRFG